MNNYLSEKEAGHYDFLTGLPGLTFFLELAETEKYEIQERGENPCFLYMDFVGMKFFNTKHGFAEGDKMLNSFGRLLADLFRRDNCCRMGADRFGVITKENGMERRLQALFDACSEINGGRSLPVHVGIYPMRIEDVSISAACDRARSACESLRGRFHSCYHYYDIELANNLLRKQYILDHLDQAIAEGWIQVYYQPIVRAVSEKVCDVEALARWIDPVEGFLSPAQFIPYLEESGQIYKLDLCVLDRVLEKILEHEREGLYVVPHSINLSRSDFDTCDMVEEVRKRVDAAGVRRAKITVEITESMIGSNFDFMKTQIERFRGLGFPVWMDDFGSAYSSLDVLQSIKFDLIKFDMGFLRRLNEGDSARIILTELMRMATALGVDTVCEGVETEEQVRFLQEIGCSKLQGYFFSPPVSVETIAQRRRDNHPLLPENPEESGYYETIGRVNLYDLTVLANTEESFFQNAFNTVPMGIVEVKGNAARFVRSNQSYRSFIKRYFGLELSMLGTNFEKYSDAFMYNVVKVCCEQGLRSFYDEKMPDGSVVHSFARRIGSDPVSGVTAVAIAVLSISEADEATTYSDIARALAADYYNIYIVDLDTDRFIEYNSPVGGQEMAVERHGEDFFEASNHRSHKIYEEDLEHFYAAFSKEKIIEALDNQGVFTLTYRLVDTGVPEYVNMKITRMQSSGNRIIIGISIIDAQMKQQEEFKKIQQERVSLGRIAALSPDYIVLYTVDPVTGNYTQYNPSNAFERFGLAKHGENFFADVVTDAPKAIAQEDLERHLRVFTKDNVMRGIQKDGFFLHTYQLMLDGKPVPVTLNATLVDESDGKKIILGVMKDDREVYQRMLEDAYENARDTSIIFTHIAQAIARGCTDLYYVNMETDEFIEYHTDDEFGVLTEARRGSDFFEGCERDAKIYLHPDDQECFINVMKRDFLTNALKERKVFELTYRKMQDGKPFYVRMRISQVEDDPRFIVIAVSDVDELIRQRRAEERMLEERLIYARLHAITGNFICVYVVDPETGHYREFSATSDYTKSFSQAKEGTDFFRSLREGARLFAHPEERERVLSLLTQENVMTEIAQHGIFSLGYRIMREGKPLHIQLKAALVEEEEGPRLIVGLNNIDVEVRQADQFRKRLVMAKRQARTDALTGFRNKHAYLEAETQLDKRIARHRQPPFAIVMLDVNDLKKVNDHVGHSAGDLYLCDASRIIRDIFSHSPIFRIGGDEFVVIAQGEDYACIDERVAALERHNSEALATGGVVIACGMSRFAGDSSVKPVFIRADQEMYADKTRLKEEQD